MANSDNPLFDVDEGPILEVYPHWSKQELLNKEGIFSLKDVAKHLGIHPSPLKKAIGAAAEKGTDPWQGIGVRKVWGNWLIRMKQFKNFYEANFRDQAP